jgi:hypothetical protein
VFTDRMVCKELYVTDRAGLVRLAADPTPAGGLLKIQGTDGQGLALGFSDKLLGLMFIDQAGRIGPPSVLRPLQVRPARPARRRPDGKKDQPPDDTSDSRENPSDAER